ncbi:brain tumor TRIM56-like [Octopus vulgaris]|uniref:Brain tumor TRIM56-like n=1 Tax=Octopus vulgaris TaxID=6645 RepID=A0AA36BDM8_OCTVU|nr:brain tumor TRIM56-like [Octopus vulgaris]
MSSPTLSQSGSTSSDCELLYEPTVLCTKCPSCLEMYIMPKVLDCFHTFCLPCLEKSRDDPSKIICSECSFVTHLPHGTLDLATDYAISNVLESSVLPRCSAHCTGCKNTDKVAVAKCYNCANLLCANCVMAHQFMHCFEGHKVLNFNEIHQLPDDYSPSERCVTCPKHPFKVLQSFCMTCNIPVCDDCAMSEHNSGHDCQLLLGVVDNQIEKLHQLQTKVKSRSKDLETISDKLKDIDFQLCSQYQKIQNDISTTYNYFRTVLDERKQELLQELEDTFSSKIMVLNKTDSKIQQTISQISHGCQFIKKLTKYANASEILLIKCFIEQQFQRILEYYPNLHCQEFDFEFLSNFSAIRAGVQNTFGSIHQTGDFDATDWNVESTRCPRRPYKTPDSKQFSCHSQQYNSPEKVYEKWNGALDISNEESVYPSPNNLSEFKTKLINSSFSTSSKPQIRRQKMIYHCKFGEFGTLDGQFTEPSGVAVNAQNDIVIADTNNHRIQIFDKDGRFKFQFGECGKRDGQLLYPNRVAIVKSSGDIVVTERSPTHQVQIYNQYGQFIRKFGSCVLQHPRGITVDVKGRIVIVECKVMRVIIFDQFGTVINKFGCSQHLEFPNGVVVNDKEEIFISDNRAHCVKVFNYAGIFLRQVGGEGITNYPIGVGINSNGAIVIADNHNNFNVTIFTQSGQLINALESKVKHAQCFDVALLNGNSIILASKDYRIYIYRYSNYRQHSAL